MKDEFIGFVPDKDENKKVKRQKQFRKEISENYDNTFVKSLEKAVSNHFNKKIVLIPGAVPGTVEKILENGKPVDSDIENKIKKFIALKKKAFEKNSDYYFKERNSNNQKENLRHRSLGEEIIFDY